MNIQRYRSWYAKLLRLYPKPYRERFGEAMEQTFHDLCRERREAGNGLIGFVLWTFAETAAGISRENITSIATNNNIRRIALATILVLLLPLTAMQFTDEVVWDIVDFVTVGALLFGAGVTYELVAGTVANNAYRFAVAVTVGTALLLVWSNLAVGLIEFAGNAPSTDSSHSGNEQHNAANVMYLGVLAIGIGGAVIERFHARGMVRALIATAIAQALVPIIALTAWTSFVTPVEASWNLLGVNAFFVVLWVGSALLFRHAARKPGSRSSHQAR